MKFYKCKACDNIMILNAPNACCIDGWQELVPNTTDASGEKHVPVIEAEGRNVSVKVGSAEHPMLAAHYITCIVIETNQGYQKKELRPGEKPAAQLHWPKAKRFWRRMSIAICTGFGWQTFNPQPLPEYEKRDPSLSDPAFCFVYGSCDR